MDYCYNVCENDSFYLNWNYEYFLKNKSIMGMKYDYSSKEMAINKFDCDSKSFTPTEKINQINYENFKQVTYFSEYFTCGFVIDAENKQFSKTSKFPYLISEIDGNYITSCTLNNKIYIFHSRTWDYETGVFIFDIETNKFNDSDFEHNSEYIQDDGNDDDDTWSESDIVSKYTNKFKNLHKKEITSCYVYNNDIILNVRDNDVNKICKYDPMTDNLTEMLITTDLHDIKINNNILFGKHWGERNVLYIYNITEKQFIIKYEICNQDEIVIFWELSGGKLFVMSNKYVYPYGQIYKENHDDDCKIRNFKIKQFDINAMI